MEKAGGCEEEAAGKSPSLPPPPPTVPSKYSIASRCGVGTSGRQISLLANHYEVSVNATNAVFYQYTVGFFYVSILFFLDIHFDFLKDEYSVMYGLQVTISSEDRAVESKGIGRKLVDKLDQTYSSELDGKRFAYDGEKSLYTVGPLPQNKFEFTIVLEESFSKRYILLLDFTDFSF